MRFLSVAEREMRAAARRPVTYYTRWLTGLGAFGLLLWLLWAMDGFTNRGAAAQILQVFSLLTFCYCLLLGTARTADCLSSEKRDGTLGLLFLTNLNSAEIVVGKLCSHALATVYGLLAIFPILALLLLMGGVTGTTFFHTVLALLNAIFASLVVGLIASVLFTRQFPAVAFALGLMIVWGAGLLGVAAMVNEYKGHPLVVQLCAVLCPLYALLTADGTRLFGGNYYWQSLGAVAALAALGVMGVAWRLARSWRDRPAIVRTRVRWKFWQRPQPQPQSTAGRTQLRRRLLDINPFYWLAGRKLVSAPVFMGIALVLVLVTVYVTVPFFQETMRREKNAAMIGSLLGWVWTVMAVHGLVMYYAAMIASQRLAEDKQTGALEMILCTPTTERSIARGLWLAFFRRMAFPAGLVWLVHGLFFWQILVMCTLEPPGSNWPRGITETEFFWAIVWNEPVRGRALDWGFVMMTRVFIFLLPGAMFIWITLGWVGRWLGLKMKHPGFAPLVALALTFVPPILIFSLGCYIADEVGIFRMPDRQIAPLVTASAFAWGSGYCLLLCWWAARRLRSDFRSVVTSRFQPPSARRWWRPNWRGVVRFGLWLLAISGVIVLSVGGFFAYQNWSTQRGWKQFQADLRQRGEPLDFPLPQPAPVPDAENLARQPAFQQTLRGSQNLAAVVNRMSQLQVSYQRWTQDGTTPWTTRKPFPLSDYAKWINPARTFGGNTNRTVIATAMLADLAAHRDSLRDLALAANLPYYQTTTNWDAAAVIRTEQGENYVLERVHFLFAIRASALLETGQSAAAAADVQTGLRLARLARQTPDARAAMRQQILLARTLQPVWEGLREHKWSATELAQFETELARFTLLADYTNDVRRAVLAHLQIWSQFPERPIHLRQTPTSSGNSYTVRAEWRHEPANWWYDRCRRLYAAGQEALARVDGANGWVQLDYDGSALDDLPLNDDIQLLLQPYHWGAPQPHLLAFAQTMLNQARLAGALERYWLANGAYPDRLTALVPTWLPQVPDDPVSKRPMAYERISKAHYVLRSFGPDREADRKGTATDDWLWSYPTNAPAK